MGVVERGGDLGGQRDAFQFQKARTADADPAPFDPNSDAVAQLVLRRVGPRQHEALFFRLLQDCQRDRVMEPVLGRRGIAQDVRRGISVDRDDPADLRALAGQCTGLVKKNGIDVAEQIQRAAVLDQHAALGTQCQRRQHRQRGGHPDAGAHIAVEHRGGALRAHGAERQRAYRERRDHRLVGQLFAALLRGEGVARGVVENSRDFRGRGFLARPLHRNMHFSCDHDGRSKHRIADTLLGGRRFPGQRVLVDHRQPLDNDAIHRHDLAGMHHDDVTLLQLGGRNLDFLTVHQQPDEAGLLAERAKQHLLGAVLGAADQKAAERQTPAQDGAGQDLPGTQTCQHHDGIEHVDAEPPLLRHDPVGALETRQRGVGEQRGGHRQQRRGRELRHGGQRQRGGADRQVAVDGVELRRMFCRCEHSIEHFDQLRHVDTSGVVFDVDTALDRVAVVTGDAECAHQFAFDRIAKRALSVQQGVAKPDGSDPLAFHTPSGDAAGIAPVAHHAMPVARGGSRGDGHRLVRFRRAVTECLGQLIEHAPASVPTGIIAQVDAGRARRREGRVLDRGKPERGLQKAPA